MKRNELSLNDIFLIFPDNETAENWFIRQRWVYRVQCPFCQSTNVAERKTVKMAWRCRPCRKDFSTKTGTLMQGSPLGFRIWAIAIYAMTTSLKGIASTKLASDLGITQKSAWHLSHRIRKAYEIHEDKLSGVVEVDEAYFGGKEENKHHSKRSGLRGFQGKQAIVGAKERGGKIRVDKIAKADRATLESFISKNIADDSTIMTDDNMAYRKLKHKHYYVVQHFAEEYVRGNAHTNGIEGFWSLLKRGYHGHIII